MAAKKFKDFKDNDEKKTLAQKISAFLSRHRIVLISIPAALILIAGIYGIITLVSTSVAKKDFEKLDTILYSLEKKATGASEADLDEHILVTKEELREFVAKKTNGATSARAFMALASLEFEQEQYQAAMEAYVACAKANPKAYTAGVAYYNAAVCAEELGQGAEAIQHFEKVLEAKDFVLVPHTLYNMGRISIDLQNKDAARGYFQKLVDDYPRDSWANLAKSELLRLEVETSL